MKDKKHNAGELTDLHVKIEKELADSLQVMSKNSKYTIDEIVVIALKRFRSSHSDYLGKNPELD